MVSRDCDTTIEHGLCTTIVIYNSSSSESSTESIPKSFPSIPFSVSLLCRSVARLANRCCKDTQPEKSAKTNANDSKASAETLWFTIQSYKNSSGAVEASRNKEVASKMDMAFKRWFNRSAVTDCLFCWHRENDTFASSNVLVHLKMASPTRPCRCDRICRLVIGM